VSTILLVGVDLFFRGKLEGLLPGHRLITSDSVENWRACCRVIV